MEVNFDNLRAKACRTYDRLANKLNNALAEYEKEYLEKGVLEIHAYEIAEEMEQLKMLIGTIAMCSNGSDIHDVFEKIYPDDKCMVDFNA
jgi:hypothetical protein